MATEIGFEWFGDKILEETNSVMAKVSKRIAENVMADAKKNLIKNSQIYGTSNDGLLAQFYAEKSRFKDGGYIVYSQGPKKWWKPYHASFVEMGTYKDEAQPYMRPAIHKNKNKANKMYRDDLDTWMRKG